MSCIGQTLDGDWNLVQGQLQVVTDVAQAACIELRNKFKFVRGEYFLDTRLGVPYFQVVFVKNPSTLVLKALFTEIILSVQGIASIISLSVTRVNASRIASFAFRAMVTTGQIISGGSDRPFIVEPQ